MKDLKCQFIIRILVIGILLIPLLLTAQSTLNCSLCHATNHNLWLSSRHANTQNDVAEELAGEWAGLPPDSVINGSEAENCVACHGPVAVSVNGGMTEVEVLSHFFSTTDGVFTDTTHAVDSTNWPHVFCTTCHDVPADHPNTMPELAIFNSSTAQYVPVVRSSVLCGQCHGTLRYADTDHRKMDAWLLSRHGHGGQADVAGELGEEWNGVPPDSVINGSEAEDCIACHAPTAILVNGGISETEALQNFFTTTDGVFTENTAPQDTAQWPEVACISCHNPHQPGAISLFNSQTGEYETMNSAQELCGQCHGNLRFPDTDHLSYNIEAGTGGIGVDDQITMPGVQCTDCHMHEGEEEDTNASMFGGHSWSIFIEEEDGSVSASCTSCHSSMDAEAAENQIETWLDEFAELDSMAQIKVAKADSAMAGETDPVKLQYLEEAHHNLEFAESDESGGFHNHKYAMALLNDAIEKADILTGIESQPPAGLDIDFSLEQNYPNPFNSSTMITFSIKKAGHYTINIYNVNGQFIKTLLNANLKNQKYHFRVQVPDLASGLYYYELKGEGFRQVKKFILMK